MAVFPNLDFIQIKARYPKAVAKIQEWVFNQPELQSVTDEFIDPKDPEKSKEMFVGLLIQMDPRKLYDIFDSLNIQIAVFLQDGYWDIQINGTVDMIGSLSRHTAEVSAFHEAFELLEKQL
jgi:hypothetical protein